MKHVLIPLRQSEFGPTRDGLKMLRSRVIDTDNARTMGMLNRAGVKLISYSNAQKDDHMRSRAIGCSLCARGFGGRGSNVVIRWINGPQYCNFPKRTLAILAPAVSILKIIYKNHPKDFSFNDNNFISKLYGSDDIKINIINKDSILLLSNSWTRDSAEFMVQRKPYLLY